MTVPCTEIPVPLRRMAMRWVVASVVIGLAPGAGAAPLWEKKWIEVRTPNFVINSALDEKRSLELARQLETFRSVVGAFTNISQVPERVPTHIYLFASRAPEAGLEKNMAGYFYGQMRGNYMPMYFKSYRQALEILQHEYTHFLMYNHSKDIYPRWYVEGFAEFLSTVTSEANIAQYGTPPEYRIDWLFNGNWEPFERILDFATMQKLSARREGMFYAQSWALVHYLILGRSAGNFQKEFALYLELQASGRSPVDAFADAFGESVKDLKKNIMRSFENGVRYLKISFSAPIPDSELQVRTLRADEIAARIGFLVFSIGKVNESQKYYEAALIKNPDNAPALVGMADLHKLAKRYDQAIPLYERAIALEPDQALHELDYGEYFQTRARLEEDVNMRKQWIELARNHLERSLVLDEGNPEALAMYGTTYLIDGESPGKGLDKLILASNNLPANFSIQMHLAKAYVAVGTPDMAIPILRRVYELSHGGRAEEAAEVLATIDPGFTRNSGE